MYTRHNEMPQLSSRQGQVEAIYFNHVQTGLKRIGKQLRFKIPQLKHLDIILQQDAWIVVDRVLNDYPIVVWTDFEAEHRDALHQPIGCEIRFFHYAASLILKRTLEAMEQMLTEELAELIADDMPAVIDFKKDELEQ